MNFGRNQQNGQQVGNVLSHHFGKLTTMVLAAQSIMKADWTSKSCGAHEEGVPARYYLGHKEQNIREYNSRVLRGLCSTQVGQNSSVGAAQRAFKNRGPTDEIWLKYFFKPEEKIKGLGDDKKGCCDYEDLNEDAECEMEDDGFNIPDIYSATIPAGHPNPMGNNRKKKINLAFQF